MAVSMKRSTNTVPESLSTSYLTGSAFMGISTTTLNSSGNLLPAGTRSKLMLNLTLRIKTRKISRGRSRAAGDLTFATDHRRGWEHYRNTRQDSCHRYGLEESGVGKEGVSTGRTR